MLSHLDHHRCKKNWINVWLKTTWMRQKDSRQVLIHFHSGSRKLLKVFCSQKWLNGLHRYSPLTATVTWNPLYLSELILTPKNARPALLACLYNLLTCQLKLVRSSPHCCHFISKFYCFTIKYVIG